MRKTAALLSVFTLVLAGVSGCGEKKWEPSAEQKKVMNGKYWAYDREASEKLRNELVKDTTGITADVELKGDVGAMADFLTAGKLFFTQDTKSGKPAWQQVSGSGLLSSKSSGWMEWQGDKKFVLKGFETKGSEKLDAEYDVKEVSDTRLVLQRTGAALPEVYVTE
jgi:hypothetical protein